MNPYERDLFYREIVKSQTFLHIKPRILTIFFLRIILIYLKVIEKEKLKIVSEKNI